MKINNTLVNQLLVANRANAIEQGTKGMIGLSPDGRLVTEAEVVRQLNLPFSKDLAENSIFSKHMKALCLNLVHNVDIEQSNTFDLQSLRKAVIEKISEATGKKKEEIEKLSENQEFFTVLEDFIDADEASIRALIDAFTADSEPADSVSPSISDVDEGFHALRLESNDLGDDPGSVVQGHSIAGTHIDDNEEHRFDFSFNSNDTDNQAINDSVSLAPAPADEPSIGLISQEEDPLSDFAMEMERHMESIYAYTTHHNQADFEPYVNALIYFYNLRDQSSATLRNAMKAISKLLKNAQKEKEKNLHSLLVRLEKSHESTDVNSITIKAFEYFRLVNWSMAMSLLEGVNTPSTLSSANRQPSVNEGATARTSPEEIDRYDTHPSTLPLEVNTGQNKETEKRKTTLLLDTLPSLGSLFVPSNDGDLYNVKDNGSLVYKKLKCRNKEAVLNNMRMMAATTLPDSNVVISPVEVDTAGYYMKRASGKTLNTTNRHLIRQNQNTILRQLLVGMREISAAGYHPMVEHGGNVMFNPDTQQLYLVDPDAHKPKELGSEPLNEQDALSQIEMIMENMYVDKDNLFFTTNSMGDVQFHEHIVSFADIEQLLDA